MNLAMCLANNRENVANMVLLAGAEVSWGWYASRIQLSGDGAVITISPRPERPEQVEPFTLDLEATDAVKVELSSGGDHYFGDRAAMIGVELPMRLQAMAHCVGSGQIDRALAIAEATASLCRDAEDRELAACAAASAGEVFRQCGRFAEAESALVDAVAWAREAIPAGGLERAAVIENLGSLRLDQGRLGEARDLFAEVVELREATGDAAALAQGLCSLGLACSRGGDSGDAIAASRRALQALDAAGIGDHHLRWRATHNLGMALGMSGDLDASRPLLEQALAGREALLGEHHPETAESAASLGTLFFVAGDVDRAIELQRRALELAERCYPAGHLEIAQRAVDLASSYKLLRTLEAAEAALPLLERAHQIRRARLGDAHALTASVASELAALRVALG